VQWLATGSEDLLTWKKHRANPVMTSALHKDVVIHDWRDPFLWKEGDTYFAVLGGHREGGKGCAVIYQSKNLTEWTYLNILVEGKEANWECPNFFKLGDRWVLIYSPHGPVKYYTGPLTKDYRFQPQTHGTLDFGSAFYAPNSLVDGKGRRILWGWMTQVKGPGWNGALTLPRLLTLRADGTLGMEPVPELRSLREKHRRLENLRITPDSAQVLKEVRGDCLEIVAEFEPTGAREFGLKVRQSADGKEGTLIVFDREHKQLVVGEVKAPFEMRKNEKTLTFHAFLDKGILEVYVNGRACVTCPLRAGPEAQGVALWASGDAVVKSLDAWEMKSSK
jgi:beta-fructofuranosidase